jgi:ubiquinone/menaquinone biosynthesis C-methylase UbiE
VLSSAAGRLLVVGIGPGYDLDHLPPAVTCVVAVDPSSSMRRRAARRVSRARVPVALCAGVAEALPVADGSVDAVLSSLVLCSVRDLDLSVSELRRVLRPGGTLHVLEHVHGPPGSAVRRWQDRLDPAWARMAAGCHVDRETRAGLDAGGFDTQDLVDVTVRPSPPMVGPHLVGVARARP